MGLLTTLSQLMLVASSSVALDPVGSSHSAASTYTGHRIKWHPCTDLEPDTPVKCGVLKVPYDYTKPRSDRLYDLEVVKFAAAKKPSKGTVFVNFGGPGASGKAVFAEYSKRLQVSTGGVYDMMTFVPRGTPGSEFAESCYHSAEAKTIDEDGIVVGNSSDTTFGYYWAKAKYYSDSCAAKFNETRRLVGTAFVVRDMMRIVDALGEDGMLRYWGFSYGTVLGATAAFMFPDRIHRMVLDGVVNTAEYYSNQDIELFKDTDKLFSKFCAHCVSNPQKCPLAGTLTAAKLEAKIWSFLDDLKFNPIPVSTPKGSFLIEYNTVKQYLDGVLDSPPAWSKTATQLASLWSGNLTAYGYPPNCDNILIPGAAAIRGMGATAAIRLNDTGGVDTESLIAIRCGDQTPTAVTREQVVKLLKARYKVSRMGGDVADYLTTRCARWGMRAKERYQGDFRAKTKHPLLIIGNTLDSVTPISSARNVSSGFPGSVVLENGGLGHTTLPQAGLCTTNAIRAYFVHGKLPKRGTICPVPLPPFEETDGWESILPTLSKGQ